MREEIGLRRAERARREGRAEGQARPLAGLHPGARGEGETDEHDQDHQARAGEGDGQPAQAQQAIAVVHVIEPLVRERPLVELASVAPGNDRPGGPLEDDRKSGERLHQRRMLVIEIAIGSREDPIPGKEVDRLVVDSRLA